MKLQVFFLLILVAGGAGLVGKKACQWSDILQQNHTKSQSQKQRMELLWGAADVIWVHTTFYLNNQLPKSFTFLLTRRSSPFLARIQMQNIWRRPHRMTYRHFLLVEEKRIHVFQPKPIFFTRESLGPLGEDFSYFRIGLQWDLPTEFPPPIFGDLIQCIPM